jgi:xylulokinase
MGLVAATGDNFRTVFSKPKIAKTIMPEKTALAAYEGQFQRYKKIYPSIREI